MNDAPEQWVAGCTCGVAFGTGEGPCVCEPRPDESAEVVFFVDELGTEMLRVVSDPASLIDTDCCQ